MDSGLLFFLRSGKRSVVVLSGDCQKFGSLAVRVKSSMGAKYLSFFLLLISQNERTYLCSVCILFEEGVFIFQFLNDIIHNHVYNSQLCFV